MTHASPNAEPYLVCGCSRAEEEEGQPDGQKQRTEQESTLQQRQWQRQGGSKVASRSEAPGQNHVLDTTIFAAGQNWQNCFACVQNITPRFCPKPWPEL